MCCHPKYSVETIYEDESMDLNQLLDQNVYSLTKDSNYYSISDYGELNGMDYGLRIMHVNIQSLPSKIDDLKVLLYNLQLEGTVVDVILVCETFLTDWKVPKCAIDNYKLYETHRRSGSRGGVGVYVHKNIQSEGRDDLQIFIEGQLETEFVEINLYGKSYIVGELYRIPGSDLKLFFENYEALITKMNLERKTLIVGMDQNIDYLKLNLHENTEKFLDMNFQLGLVPMITRPTRVTSRTATLIDNIYTNDIAHVKSSILLAGISDHLPCCLFMGHKHKKEPLTIHSRKLNEEKINNIKQSLTGIDWAPLTDMNVNNAYDMFINQINDCLDTHAPMRTITISQKNVIRDEWMTPGLLQSSKTRDKLYKQQVGFPIDHPNHVKYVNYRNQYNRLKRFSKKDFYYKQIEYHKNSSKKLWNILNKVIGKTRNKMELPNKIKDTRGILVHGSLAIANTFCDFFSNVGPNLASKIPVPNRTYLSYMDGFSCDSALLLAPTDPYEISRIINKLGNKTSSGYDGISNIFLKQISAEICLPLSIIFNKSIESAVFPDSMKLGDIMPVYKSKDRASCTNYRPISLLPVVSKVLERIIYKRVYHYLTQHNLLYNSQYGFRSKHSTINAITEFVGKIANGFENGEYTLGVFLDLSKAFDTIDHDILLYKLEKYGIRGHSNQWFKSYLSSRSQQVKYNDVRSKALPVRCGVPQGSVLGPLLFIIYTNDIHRSLSESCCILFADDTTVYMTDKDQGKLAVSMTQDIHTLCDWFKANKLSLNLDKTNCIMFHPKGHNIDHDFKLIIGNSTINLVSDTKFLGLFIDEQLNWSTHLTKVRLKISSGLFMLNSVRNLIPSEQKKTIYMSFINSHLVYGTMLWGPMSMAGGRSKLHNSQIKAMKAITDVKSNNISQIFKKYEVLKLEDIINLELEKFMYNQAKGELPLPLLDLFQNAGLNHHYDTRGKYYANVPKHHKSTLNRSFLVRGPALWRTLSYDLRRAPSLKSFTRNYKKELMSGY